MILANHAIHPTAYVAGAFLIRQVSVLKKITLDPNMETCYIGEYENNFKKEIKRFLE